MACISLCTYILYSIVSQQKSVPIAAESYLSSFCIDQVGQTQRKGANPQKGHHLNSGLGMLGFVFFKGHLIRPMLYSENTT